MDKKLSLTLSEQIDRAKSKEGRSQTWIIAKMVENGIEMSSVRFSRKKLESYPNDLFTEKELNVLSQILNTSLMQ